MRIMHETVIQLDCAMLMLMSTMLSTASCGFDTDGEPVAKWHMHKVVLS